MDHFHNFATTVGHFWCYRYSCNCRFLGVRHLLKYYKYLYDLCCTVNYTSASNARIGSPAQQTFTGHDGEIDLAILNGRCRFSCHVCVSVLRNIKHKSKCHVIEALDVYVNIGMFAFHIQIFAPPPHIQIHSRSHLASVYSAYSVHYSQAKICHFQLCPEARDQCDREKKNQ